MSDAGSTTSNVEQVEQVEQVEVSENSGPMTVEAALQNVIQTALVVSVESSVTGLQ